MLMELLNIILLFVFVIVFILSCFLFFSFVFSFLGQVRGLHLGLSQVPLQSQHKQALNATIGQDQSHSKPDIFPIRSVIWQMANPIEKEDKHR